MTKDFSFKEYLKKMHNDKKRHIQVIAFFLEEKGIKLDSEGQVKVAIKRHSRAAVQLAEFNDKQIVWACGKAKKDYPDFTIETLVKILTR